ncbi:hypothetical protein [Bradyrhizobium sp. USDA 4353]
MLKAIGRIVYAIWAVCAIATGTFVGVAAGLHSGGWIGAVVLGIVGLVVGAVLAAFPLEVIVLILEGI